MRSATDTESYLTQREMGPICNLPSFGRKIDSRRDYLLNTTAIQCEGKLPEPVNRQGISRMLALVRACSFRL